MIMRQRSYVKRNPLQIADLLEQLYESQGEEILVNTGYYDQKEDQRNGEEDKYSGYWYVTVN